MNIAKEPRVEYRRTPKPVESSAISNISKSRAGISFSHALDLADRLSLSLDDLSHILHLSTRSLHRYDDNKVLATNASAVILRLEGLLSDGLETFEDITDFAEWLKAPLPYLGGDTPFSFLDTPFGFDLIHQALGRIRHGIFA